MTAYSAENDYEKNSNKRELRSFLMGRFDSIGRDIEYRYRNGESFRIRGEDVFTLINYLLKNYQSAGQIKLLESGYVHFYNRYPEVPSNEINVLDGYFIDNSDPDSIKIYPPITAIPSMARVVKEDIVNLEQNEEAQNLSDSHASIENIISSITNGGVILTSSFNSGDYPNQEVNQKHFEKLVVFFHEKFELFVKMKNTTKLRTVDFDEFILRLDNQPIALISLLSNTRRTRYLDIISEYYRKTYFGGLQEDNEYTYSQNRDRRYKEVLNFMFQLLNADLIKYVDIYIDEYLRTGNTDETEQVLNHLEKITYFAKIIDLAIY